MGGNRGRHELNIDNSPDGELYDSGYTGLLLEIRFFVGGWKGVCGSAVAGRASFCMSYIWMNETPLHTPCQEDLYMTF